jgi:hypothetical protein
MFIPDPDPHKIENYFIFEMLKRKLSPSSQKYGFGIRDPGSVKKLFFIPDPGVKRHRILDPDPQHCSGLFFLFFVIYLPGEWLVGEERAVELPQQVVQQQHHGNGNPRPTGGADASVG